MKKTIKFMTLFITILIVNLIEEKFETFLSDTAHHHNPYIFTIIGMCLLFISIYFLFVKMDDIVNFFIEKFLKAGKNIIGKKVGIFIVFFIILMVVYCFYANLWYDINIWLKIIS